MTEAGRRRSSSRDDPFQGFRRSPPEDLSLLTGTHGEGAEESDRRDAALPAKPMMTHRAPPAIRVIRLAILEPRQPLLKTGMPAPAQFGEPLQRSCRQPRFCAPALSTGETALTRRGFEERLGRRLKSGILGIRAPLDRREQPPARPRIGSPKRHIGGPRSVRMKVCDQGGHRLDNVGTATGSDDGHALRRSPHQLHQHPPVEIRAPLIEQPGKGIAAQRFPGVGANRQLDAARATQLDGVPEHPQCALDAGNPPVAALEGYLIVQVHHV